MDPLNRGLGPLADNGLTLAVRRIVRDNPDARFQVYGTTTTVALVRGGGAEVVSGTTPYPDASIMSELLPGQRATWNSYATYIWVAEPASRPARVVPVRGTTRQLLVPTCSSQIRDLGAQWVVSEARQTAGCLRPLGTVEGAGKRFNLYRVR